MIKKTYIPAKPRNKKLIGTGGSGGISSSMSGAVANSHTHANKAVLDLFKQDSDGNVYLEQSFYSMGGISALGLGEGGGSSGGGGVDMLDSWAKYTEAKANFYAPASLLVPFRNDALSRLSSLESGLATHTHTFASLTNKPTTLAGYEITDAVPTSRTITAGTGLTGGGNLTANRTFNIDAAMIPNTSTPLATSDLDNITTPGFYHQSGDANATAERNYPEGQGLYAGSLRVYNSTSGGVVQVYTLYGTQNRSFTRGFYNSTWYAWRQIAYTDDNITGNANTATKLQTAITIAGVSFDGSANIAIPFDNLVSKPTTISGYEITDAYTKEEVNSISDTITTALNTHASNWVTDEKHLTDAQLAYLNDLIGWWKVDASGNLYTEKNIYSTKGISALGLGEGGGSSGGGGVDMLDSWAKYTEAKANFYAPASLLVSFRDYTLDKLNAIEGGSASAIATTGTGNAITSVSKDGNLLTFDKGLTFASQSDIDTAIDGIEIGGRNLILRSTNLTNISSADGSTISIISNENGEVSFTASSGDGGSQFKAYWTASLSEEKVVGDTYTASAWVKNTRTDSTRILVGWNGFSEGKQVYEILPSDGWVLVKQTGKASIANTQIQFSSNTPIGAVNASFKKPMLQEGNKGTGWELAPEDQVSDWNETDVNSYAYLKNKPTQLSQFIDDIGVGTHIENKANPHAVTKAQVGLENVDNTSDLLKPISNAVQTALNLKANLASPTFTGNVTAPTFIGALSGNASTATKLDSIHTTFTGIYPVAFNVNGDIYSHTDITYKGSTGELSANTFVGALSGNASSATKLQTAITIAGVTFDGTADIDIPFANLANKPNTLSGYGITDAVTLNTTQSITGTKTFTKRIGANLGVKIGTHLTDGLIEWDATNNAFKFNGSVYATGGISALGLGEGGSSGGGVDMLDSWANYTSVKANYYVPASLLVPFRNDTLSRLTGLQGTLDLKATQSDIDTAIDNTGVTSHIANKANPHAVTTAQIGAVDLTTNQTIGGNKSFTGTMLLTKSAGETPLQTRGIDGNLNGVLDNLYLNSVSTKNILMVGGGGNVGIGTTNPLYKLDVAGDGRFTGNVTAPTFTGDLEGNASSATNLSRSVLTGTGLSGGGVLNANRTLSLDTDYTDNRYLQRSGGSMLNTNLVTNLNANFVGGLSSDNLTRGKYVSFDNTGYPAGWYRVLVSNYSSAGNTMSGIITIGKSYSTGWTGYTTFSFNGSYGSTLATFNAQSDITRISGGGGDFPRIRIISGISTSINNPGFAVDVWHNGTNGSIAIHGIGMTTGAIINSPWEAVDETVSSNYRVKVLETPRRGLVSDQITANDFHGALSGNASSATKLQTAITIAGVTFDGTADIDIPFANLANKPNTLSGYGITDAVTLNTTQSITGEKTFEGSVDILSSYSYLRIGRIGGDNRMLIGSDATTTAIYSRDLGSGAYPFRIVIGSTEVMRFGADYNVGIGTTNPLYKLDVSGTGRFTGNVTASAGINTPKVDFGNGFTIEPSGTELVFKYNNVIKQRMLSDGTILATAGITALSTE